MNEKTLKTNKKSRNQDYVMPWCELPPYFSGGYFLKIMKGGYQDFLVKVGDSPYRGSCL